MKHSYCAELRFHSTEMRDKDFDIFGEIESRRDEVDAACEFTALWKDKTST